MRSAKAARDSSFAAFMDQAGPALLRTAWFLTGDAERAQELTQAAFVKTYLSWHKIDHDRALAYARRCLVNHRTDVWRATRREVVTDLTSAVPDGGSASASHSASGSSSQQSRDGATDTTDHRDDLVRRLARLPEQQRKVVVLRYYADQSEAAVAETLGISVGTVKSTASRGLAALRQHAEAHSAAEAEARRAAKSDTAHQTQAKNAAKNVTTTPEGSLR